MASAQVVGGLFLLVLGVLTSLFASRLSYGSEVGPGPGFLPLWIGIGLALCGVATTVKAVRLRRARRTESAPFFMPKTRQVVFIFLTLVATFLLLPVFGLSFGLALFTGFTMRITGRHGWFWCGLATVVTAAAVRFVFGYLLDIPLPRGLVGI